MPHVGDDPYLIPQDVASVDAAGRPVVVGYEPSGVIAVATEASETDTGVSEGV